MEDEILKFKAMQEVQTPYGPGIVVGQVVEADGTKRGIVVSHSYKVDLPEELRPPNEGPCYLLEYPLEQLKVRA